MKLSNEKLELLWEQDQNGSTWIGSDFLPTSEAEVLSIKRVAFIRGAKSASQELLDTIERYERALKHISRYIDTAGCAKCDRAYPNVDRVEHLEKVALNALAREALNPKEGA